MDGDVRGYHWTHVVDRGVQKNPDPKSNPKYPKIRIRNNRNFGYPKIHKNQIIRIFRFGYEFQKFRIIRLSDIRKQFFL
ncbi:hypothetical protein Hanom_Chr10g00901491 [Helianthus anomalus]